MKLLHEIAIFQTVKSKVIISLFETVRLSVSISLRNLYNSLNSIKEIGSCSVICCPIYHLLEVSQEVDISQTRSASDIFTDN